MTDFFPAIIIAHLLGDYMFQPKYMALNKTYDPWLCLLHAAIYTLCVCLCVWNFSLVLVLAILTSHFAIDYWSLGLRWLDLINGRNYYVEFHDLDTPYRELRIPFAAIVYVIVDNGLHIMWAYGIINYLMYFNLMW